MHLAAAYDRVHAIMCLLGAGAEVNAWGADGYAALYLAVGAGGLHALKMLLDGGADMDAAERGNGDTAFHVAVELGREVALGLLLIDGVDVCEEW